jgi:thioredoxin-related protein
MKKSILFFFFVTGILSVQANNADSLYHPMANAKKDIADAVAKAKQEKKHVLIQAGGNWCGWCKEFNRFTTTDKQMDSAINADYIVYHLNYSPQNKNAEIFKQYGFPNRFGYPVFLILDANGKLIHTQNSSYLEEGRSYSKKKVLDFLVSWRPQVFDEKNYKDLQE